MFKYIDYICGEKVCLKNNLSVYHCLQTREVDHYPSLMNSSVLSSFSYVHVFFL